MFIIWQLQRMTKFRLLSISTIAFAILQSPSGTMAFVNPLALDRMPARYLLTSTRIHIRDDIPYFLSNKTQCPSPDPACKVSLSSDVCEQTGVTLSRYILEYIRANPESKGINIHVSTNRNQDDLQISSKRSLQLHARTTQWRKWRQHQRPRRAAKEARRCHQWCSQKSSQMVW